MEHVEELRREALCMIWYTNMELVDFGIFSKKTCDIGQLLSHLRLFRLLEQLPSEAVLLPAVRTLVHVVGLQQFQRHQARAADCRIRQRLDTSLKANIIFQSQSN